MKFKLALVLLLGAAISHAQIPTPQIPITGNLGSAGVFPLLNSGTLVFSADANHAMVSPEMSASFIKVTSSVPLTATRNLVAPLAIGFSFTIQNATTGGQSIQIIGSTGTGVTIANGATVQVASDGTNYVSTSGGSGIVQPTPQFSLMIQPNSGTQAVAGGASTAQNAVTPLLQGAGNTDLYQTGGGNNGIANFLTSFPTGYATVPSNSTSTEAPTTPPTGALIEDKRGGATAILAHNNIGLYPCPSSGGVTFNYTRCTSSKWDLAQNIPSQTSNYFETAGPGYNNGSPGAGSATLWQASTQSLDYFLALTRGIKTALGVYQDSHGIGDTNGLRVYQTFDGGQYEGSYEGNVALYGSSTENTSYIHATIATGGTTGSNLLTVSSVTGSDYFTDGGYLLDTTATSVHEGVMGSVGSGPVVASGTPFGWWVMSGATVTPSTAWGVFNTNTDSSATGRYQVPVTQTINVTLGTLPTASAPLTTGTACLVGVFTETVPVTAVGTPSGGVQAVTFSTRYGWNAGSTMIMQGGDCGKYATVTGASWKSSLPIIGALSSTQLVLGACLAGSCNMIGNDTTIAFPVSSDITAYQGAEITGTQNGAPNTVQLAYNTAAWANGDSIQGPHPWAVNALPLSLAWGQTTPVNGNAGAVGINMRYDGPAVGNVTNNSGMIYMNTRQPLWSIINAAVTGSGAYDRLVYSTTTPSFAVLDYHDAPDNTTRVYQGANGIFYYMAGGSFSFLQGSNYAVVNAANVPGIATATAQIPISTSFGNGPAPNYQPFAPSGDLTMDAGGVFTFNTVNGNVGTCGDATHVCQVTLDGKGRTTAATAVAITGGGGVADPGANGIMKRTALDVTAPATYSDVTALLATDTVDNSQYGFHAGSGGDSTCSTPAAGADYLCFYGGAATYVHGAGTRFPLSYYDPTSSIQTQLNGKQQTLTLTTTGTSGPATLSSGTLNIPQYSGGSSGPSMTIPRDLNYHSAAVDANSGGGALNTWSMSTINSVGTRTYFATADAAGYVGYTQTSTTTANTDVGTVATVTAKFINPSMHAVFHLGSPTSVNAWVALCSFCNVSLAGTVDTTTSSTVGFRHFDSQGGSEATNWTCYISDGTHSGATIDSGVAVDTAKMQVFDVIWVSGIPQFYINQTRVCSGISTVNLPASASNMGVAAVFTGTTTTPIIGSTYSLYFGSN